MKLKITVHGVSYEVDVEVLDAGDGFVMPTSLPTSLPAGPAASAAAPPAAVGAPPPRAAAPAAPAAGGGSASVVASPIAGTVQEVKCSVGAQVQRDDVLLVIEAMKMNTSIAAPVAGKIKAVSVGVGDAVREGQTLVEFE